MKRADAVALRACTALLAALALSGCLQAAKTGRREVSSPPVSLRILYTNDEHGWIEGLVPGHGAGALWSQARAEPPAEGFELWLSGGDNWTGPAISTWFEGRSTVEVMRRMGYRAAAVGNHEFDFGLESLRERIAEAGFPYLAANMVRRSSGRLPEDLGIRSHALIDVGGLRVGVIGLITTDTPRVTNPAGVAEFDFLPYEPSLRRAAAAARAEGAKVLLVLAHVCVDELRELAENVEDLGIAFFGGGHCNESHGERVGGAVLLSTAGAFSELGCADLRFDRRSGRLLEASWSRRPNQGEPGETELSPIVARWDERTSAELGSIIAHLDEALELHDPRLGQLVVDSWLEAIPSGEVALMNRGGIRAGLPAGDLTLADVVAMLPFQNVLVEAKVPGAVLERALAAHRPIAGGLRRTEEGWVSTRDGERLAPERRYRVVVNSFCFAGGDGWTFLAESDPDALDTGIHFRQPVIDHFRR